jgi:mycothiol synthase
MSVRSSGAGVHRRAIERAAEIERELGWRPISDHTVVELQAERADVSETDDGIAIVTRASDHLQLDVIPTSSRVPSAAFAAGVAIAAATASADRPTELHWWAFDVPRFAAHAAVSEIAEAAGFAQTRTLWQMRIDLAASSEWFDPVSAPLPTRAFDPAEDAEAWVRVNNAAFAGHAEQSGWTVDQLIERLSEPWASPEDIRLHDRGGGLAAFCWTKRHPPTLDGATVGEIYVIAVDPRYHGQGLGRAITSAGLAYMHDLGIRQAILFVAADNASAVRMYHSLGFTHARTDIAYVLHIDPAPATLQHATNRTYSPHTEEIIRDHL